MALNLLNIEQTLRQKLSSKRCCHRPPLTGIVAHISGGGLPVFGRAPADVDSDAAIVPRRYRLTKSSQFLEDLVNTILERINRWRYPVLQPQDGNSDDKQEVSLQDSWPQYRGVYKLLRVSVRFPISDSIIIE